MESIQPLKPAVPYVGGKRFLSATLVPLLQSFPAQEMTAHPVSALVNSVRNKSAEVIRPLG